MPEQVNGVRAEFRASAQVLLGRGSHAASRTTVQCSIQTKWSTATGRCRISRLPRDFSKSSSGPDQIAYYIYHICDKLRDVGCKTYPDAPTHPVSLSLFRSTGFGEPFFSDPPDGTSYHSVVTTGRSGFFR